MQTIRPKRFRLVLAATCLLATPAVAAWVGSAWSFTPQVEKTEIYRGVDYTCTELNGGGIHLVEIDLSKPGIELFMTPLDPAAVERGFQYRLDYVRNVARASGLAVAVNGAIFDADSYMLPMVGDFARSVDTIVADHRTSHLHQHSYLLWFEDDLTPHLETSKPPSREALEHAKWAIGGQGAVIHEGRPGSGTGERDRRAILGVDPATRRMWIGVFESATSAEAAAKLAQEGATEAVMLDGGDSTALYLGGHAHGVPAGLRFGGHQPVATVLGVRADPIVDPL